MLERRIVYYENCQQYLPKRFRLMVGKACVTSVLFYGVEIFGKYDSVSQHKLNVAFNSIARYV